MDNILKLLKNAVRPITAYSLTATVIYMALTGTMDSNYLVAIYGSILGFYFGERSALKMPENQQHAVG